MQLVSTRPDPPAEDLALQGTPLSVVFAQGEAIERVRARGEGEILLEPPYHLSDDDAYLVIPEDIGMELVDIAEDGDLALLAETLRDGLLVIGEIVRQRGGVVHLVAERAVTPAEALPRLPYGATVVVGGGEDPVAAVNALPHVRVTVLGALVDDDSLERLLRAPERLGVSWRQSADAPDQSVDPTYTWSRRAAPGRVGIELALFREYEEWVVLLRPVELVAV